MEFWNKPYRPCLFNGGVGWCFIALCPRSKDDEFMKGLWRKKEDEGE